MKRESQEHMVREQHSQYLWVYWLVVILGIWMVASPLTFDYAKGAVSPSGGREVWLSLDNRIFASKLSDAVSGLLLLIFGIRSLQPNRPYSLWICCFIGIWMSASPLILWAPNTFIYLNDTIIGAWIIALTVLIPGTPHMMKFIKNGTEIPKGWSFNPSSWSKRWVLIMLSFLAWQTSRYLAAYQLGYTNTIWDPFFGESTIKVLNSSISKALPVSDAGLGALAYTFEFLMVFMGGTSRWRTMPWIVALFGILVIPVGFVSIVLVILQPLSVSAWCTFCLLTALIMLPMIPLEIDEVAAMIQHLFERKEKGDSFWQVFWKGGSSDNENEDQKIPELIDFSKNPRKFFLASLWGISFPWTLVFSTMIGIWVMISPDFFDLDIKTRAADLNHLIGSLIIVFSVISMSEILRICRYVNIILALILAIAPFFLKDIPYSLYVHNLIFGLIIVGLAFPKGIIKAKIWCLAKIYFIKKFLKQN